MSFGKMRDTIEIVRMEKTTDREGFTVSNEVTAASVRAYREERSGTKKWANRASFSEATDLFRFRYLHDVVLSDDMLIKCRGHTFEITSIENVRGRNMYIEVLAKEVRASGKQHNKLSN